MQDLSLQAGWMKIKLSNKYSYFLQYFWNIKGEIYFPSILST